MSGLIAHRVASALHAGLKRSVVLAELLLRCGLKLRLLGIDLRLLLLLEVRGLNGSLPTCRGARENPDGSTDRGTLAGIASNRAADSPHRRASYRATRRGVSRSVRMLLRCLLHLLVLLLSLRLLSMQVRKGLGSQAWKDFIGISMAFVVLVLATFAMIVGEHIGA